MIALDLRGISTFTDFFVICSGNSDPHLKAIVNEVKARLREEHNIAPLATSGDPMSQWIVLDYGVVIVHVLNPVKREFYSIEDLWSDAPRLVL